MATYRYLFADLLTNSVIGEFPITNVNFSQQINSAGSLSGDILISDITEPALNIINSTIPARTALYVDRDGVLVWGGIVWSRSYNSQSQKLSLSAREFESYFEKRRITLTQQFTSQDQLTIANTLISNAQSAVNGNIGVITTGATSGVLVSRTYYDYELKTVYAALQDLSKSTSGFDFTIQVAYDSAGNPTKTLKLGYPRLGTAYTTTSTTVPVFEFPAGNVVEYEYPEDGSIVANYVWAVGAGSNEGKIDSTASDATKIAAGWPLLEEAGSYSDVTDQTLLNNLALGQINAVSYPPVTLKLVVPPYQDPVFGSYVIGDDVRVRITDDRFPNGLDATYRLVALTVTPGENGPERATLTLTLPNI